MKIARFVRKNTIYASTYYVLDCPTYWYKSQMRYLRGRNIWENIYFLNKYFNTEFWLWYSIVTAWIECNSLKMWRLSSNYFVPKKKRPTWQPHFWTVKYWIYVWSKIVEEKSFYYLHTSSEIGLISIEFTIWKHIYPKNIVLFKVSVWKNLKFKKHQKKIHVNNNIIAIRANSVGLYRSEAIQFYFAAKNNLLV